VIFISSSSPYAPPEPICLIALLPVRPVLFGFVYALLAAIGFSLVFSLAICCGAAPEARNLSDEVSPLLGIGIGAWLAARETSWKSGFVVALLYVFLWIGFWLYLMGRLNPLLWIEEGASHISLDQLFWWAMALFSGMLGGYGRRIRPPAFLGLISILGLGLILATASFGIAGNSHEEAPTDYDIERIGPAPDGTVVRLLTFDFHKSNGFSVCLYDCDSDDAHPFDDANTSYLGQTLSGLVQKLNYRAGPSRRTLCVINGGFFGASGLSIAHHEEPLVQDGRALYQVDLLRPKEQGWTFAIHPSTSALAGQPRFVMAPEIPWDDLKNYKSVLGGVRPLRIGGTSISLKPGAGSTTLRCSRTSIGWSADGNKFYVLVVHDPDGEAASQIQRRRHQAQTGGWDVNEVQRFWEQRQVPFALLFDGGESTQLAFRDAAGNYHNVSSGYQYSFTVGYYHQRPLLFTLPILPPSEAHRGVLNYLYVTGDARPAEAGK
jgi:hypothetical protein